MPRRKGQKLTEAHKEALRPTQFQQPIDAPSGQRAATMNISLYPEHKKQFDQLKEALGCGNNSLVVRKALAYVIANKADFLAKSFDGD